MIARHINENKGIEIYGLVLVNNLSTRRKSLKAIVDLRESHQLLDVWCVDKYNVLNIKTPKVDQGIYTPDDLEVFKYIAKEGVNGFHNREGSIVNELNVLDNCTYEIIHCDTVEKANRLVAEHHREIHFGDK